MQKDIQLKNNIILPRIGMGAWQIGDDPGIRGREVEAIQAGIDAGIKVIDTAEMYGSGRSEQLVGQAIKKYNREDLFLVSKVLPHNAGRERIRKSLRHSLELLGTEYLDLYLLHWRGMIPLKETVECMEELAAEGKIRSWGVSNFDVEDMEELMRIPGGENCMVNQVLYHLGSRGVEYELLPWLERHDIPLMAYCPLAQAGGLREELVRSRELMEIADKYQISIVQLLLAFVLQKENVFAIPRSGRKEHVLANWEVRNLVLDKEDRQILDKAFPAPGRRVPLDIV
ncbi:MAG: aldo/keto reductase [Lachnospiraceae bacterium]|nr:aldo/keto reductase [Lachnospiraceae bacterium]